jgi:uncharacterized membrane protein YfcA
MTFWLLLTAFATAVLGAVCGIGGGVLLRPLLGAVFGVATDTASLLSGVTVLTMALVAVLRRAAQTRRGLDAKLNLRVGSLLSAGAAAGGVLGKQIFQAALRQFQSDKLAGRLQAAALLLLCVGTLVYLLTQKHIRPRMLKCPAAMIAAGLALGLISSFLGIGGGPFNHVVLSYFFGMDTKTSAVNSIFIVLFSRAASLANVAITGTWPPFQMQTLLGMAAAGALGGYLGAALARRTGQRHIAWTLRGTLGLIIELSAYTVFS